MARRKDEYPCNVVGRIVIDQILKEHNAKKPNKVLSYDPEKYNAGQNWYDSGLSIDEAPEELKNDQNFINGYERAKRLAKFAAKMYDEGVSCYDKGMSYEEVAEKYKNVPIAIKGYEDAMLNSKKK